MRSVIAAKTALLCLPPTSYSPCAARTATCTHQEVAASLRIDIGRTSFVSRDFAYQLYSIWNEKIKTVQNTFSDSLPRAPQRSWGWRRLTFHFISLEFLLFFGLNTIKKPMRQMRQLYLYVANESTLNGHIFKWNVFEKKRWWWRIPLLKGQNCNSSV